MTRISELRNALSAANCKLADDIAKGLPQATIQADQAAVDAAYNAIAVFVAQAGGGYMMDGTTVLVFGVGVNYGPPTFTETPYEPLP